MNSLEYEVFNITDAQHEIINKNVAAVNKTIKNFKCRAILVNRRESKKREFPPFIEYGLYSGKYRFFEATHNPNYILTPMNIGTFVKKCESYNKYLDSIQRSVEYYDTISPTSITR